MILLIPLVTSLFFMCSAAIVWRAKSASTARIQASVVAIFASAIGAFAFLSAPIVQSSTLLDSVGWLPTGLLSIAPFVTSLVALIALSLAPLLEHRQATFARMLLLFGFAEGFLATGHPLILATLWSASVGVTWLELRSWQQLQKWHRVFGIYQLVSVVFFGLGAWFIWQGASRQTAVILVLAGIGIREGVFPMQSWFIRFVEYAPMGVVIAFIAPQLGVYAQLELLIDGGLGDLVYIVAAFGAITAVLAALLGVVQTKARRAIAYLILSQTGLVAFGLESESAVGLTGALLNWQVLALATSGFAMALAVLEARRGSMGLQIPRGNFSQTPKLGLAFLVLGFASVGFPLTLGFVAEDLLVQGTVEQFPVLGLSLIVATALNGVTVLRAFFYLFAGEKHNTGEPDLGKRENRVFGFVVFILVVSGLLPNLLLSFESAI